MAATPPAERAKLQRTFWTCRAFWRITICAVRRGPSDPARNTLSSSSTLSSRASLTMPPGTRGVVIGSQKFSRRVNLTDAERTRALTQIRDAEKDFLRALRDYTAAMLRDVKKALATEVQDDLTGKAVAFDAAFWTKHGDALERRFTQRMQ